MQIIFFQLFKLCQRTRYIQFNREHFDYIIIDEVHKAGAISYLKLIEYFQPKFYLGMSGSPDRSDDFNIYELFDYNIPLDIRLQDALQEDLLCPSIILE